MHRRAGIGRKLVSRVDPMLLRLFGNLERTDEYRISRRVLMAEISGGRVRGVPRLIGMVGMKVALGSSGK